jgi:hypothetical protein
MATNEIGEKVYYSDDSAKVTNVRITCNHITVPIEKIGSVNINLKVEMLCLRFAISLVSASLLLFLPLIRSNLRLPIGIILGVIAAVSAIWLYLLLKNYAELVVSVGSRRVVILTSSIFNKSGLAKMYKAIGEAILDERKYCDMKQSGDNSVKFNPSETIRLKVMLDDYDRLKKLAEKPGSSLGEKKD